MKDLRFRINSRHIGQLGRELVTDFVTALVELVKNSFDADAECVSIIIENANTPLSKIIIADIGSGMTQEAFENRWMVIGTSNKLTHPYTSKGRKRAGKKGIGRFSVERLAERVNIFSFPENSDPFKVNINWNQFEEINIGSIQQRIKILRNTVDVTSAKYIANQIEYFLMLDSVSPDDKKHVNKLFGYDIHNYEKFYSNINLDVLETDILPILKKYEGFEQYIDNITNRLIDINLDDEQEVFNYLKNLTDKYTNRKSVKGMVLVLEGLRDEWRQKDIDKLQKELRLLIAPEFIEKDPFHIELKADQFFVEEEMSVNDVLSLSFAHLKAEVCNQGMSNKIVYTDKNGRMEKFEYPNEEPLLCGDFKFELFYFLRDSFNLTNENYNYRFAIKILDTYCGIKIYRDNFRVKPYGDIGNDWLQLDKAKVSDTHGYRVGNNQTVGVINIGDESNPLLIDATNREGIIENKAFEQLKDFILYCINVISSIRKEESEKEKSELVKLEEAKKELDAKQNLIKSQQDKLINNIMTIVDSVEDKVAKSESSIKLNIQLALTEYKKNEEQSQKEREEHYDKITETYQKVINYQQSELETYKNLATIGMLAGNFGHETQDIVSRIRNSIMFFEQFSEREKNNTAIEISKILNDDFNRISGYSELIVSFLRKKKREKTYNLSLKSVLEQVCLLYRNMLKEFGIELIDFCEDNILFNIRQIDLESIIINMITNAFEQVKGRKVRRIVITFLQNNENVVMHFEDSGMGVPIDQRKNIFRPFITTKEEGIGLGLNIVHDIVENYNGNVCVTASEKLGGAKFIIIFPKE